MPGIFRIIIQSISFYKKQVIYQGLIIVLLTAVITGSLLTGSSVKQSLRKSASEHLGNTEILISSGIRYFDQELVQRMQDSANLNCSGLLEINGYCQVMNSQKTALNTHIFGVSKDFFIFHGHDKIVIKPGDVAVNKRLADYLGIKQGDELIIRFKEINDIPPDAPFAPAGDAGKSVVMRVGSIVDPLNTGNFSLSISQLTPMNLFINLSELEDIQKNSLKINRLLVKSSSGNSLPVISNVLKRLLKPVDIGLRIRMLKTTIGNELISDRIFIDEAIIKEINNVLPSSSPVLTYLGNRFESGSRSTPYSFVSALPASLYPGICDGNGIIINRWMANDLSLSEGDTIHMFWYSPDSLSKLVEKRDHFIVKKIVDHKDIWSDSLLMPDFPGISGKESCSDWNAGVPIKMGEIRNKDEEYWKKHKGTPKAFIGYEKGKELWGNNFGPATAIRFPSEVTVKEIKDKLEGSLDPYTLGFSITNLLNESVNAANKSVDFGTLFLSLGFFLILAAMVLLSFAVSSYFDTKRKHIKTLFALGFTNRRIEQLLIYETALICLTGCVTGAAVGYLANVLIINALNTVWIGAVQTDAIGSYFNLLPVMAGFILTFLTIVTLMIIKVRRYMTGLNIKGKEIFAAPSAGQNLLFFFVSLIITISLFLFSIFHKDLQLLFSFTSGAMLLISIVIFWRQHYLGRFINNSDDIKNRQQLSHLYYAFNPSYAVTPILFIATGIFAVFITSTNKINYNEKEMYRSGGTGGYLLWFENSIPVKEDLNTISGRKTMGLDNDSLSRMSFVMMKKSQGNDASCLNLNHIAIPPLLGVDPSDFISKKSFSFSKTIKKESIMNPWEYLKLPPQNNNIYGIADQTVLEWGLKVKEGDTLVLRAENGQPLKIIIAAGLQTSVFQGNVLIGMDNFTKYFPSVSGSSVFLVDGNSAFTEMYRNTLSDRLVNYGCEIEKTTDRLASFYKVTNTYLSVFGFFGALGMILGVAGLGFVLLRNYNQRKQEFALLMATGFSIRKIRRMILSEQLKILFAGVSAGALSALLATLPSIRNNTDFPWQFLTLMILSVFLSGFSALYISLRSVKSSSLIALLKKE
jgi:putative ABC transport system permease protein